MPADRAPVFEILLTSLLTGESETIRLDSPLVIIGRGAQCDVRLTHPDVSRRHACLQILRDRALCVDLDSRTGVHWGGERQQTGWLHADRAARIGPFELRLVSPVATAPAVTADMLFRRHAVNRIGLRSAGLRFLNQATDTPPVSLVRPITLIGRAERCRLRLRDESVSRVHSSLMLTPDGVWIADLLGRGGVKVNGEFVSLSRLASGDEVRIGRYRLLFETDLSNRDEDFCRPVPCEPRASTERGAVLGSANGGVSETLLLAVTETFADMQRQMTEQFRLQMEMLVGLVQSMQANTNHEIHVELARLSTLSEEIRDAQVRLSQRSLTAAPPSGAEACVLSETPTEACYPDVEQGRRSQRRTSPRSEHDSRPNAAVTDHVYLARRLRELECERSSRWERLVGLLKGDS